MSNNRSQKTIPNHSAEDEPSRNVFINSKGNDIERTIAWTVEKEVEKLSMTIKEEMSGAVGRVEKSLSQILLIQSKQFCERTSLHGLAYIGEDNRPWWERTLWVISMFSFLLFGAYVMKPIYEKWQFAPTITSVETTNYPIWHIYFPAVTICSNNKIEISRIDTLLKKDPWHSLKMNYSNFDENMKLALVSFLTSDTNKTIYDESISALNISRQMIHEFKDNFTYLAQKGTPSCRDMILYCEWQGETVNCADFFEVRKTDNGFCCSFNTLKLNEQFHSSENIAKSEETDYYDDVGVAEWYSSYYSTLTTGCYHYRSINNGFCDNRTIHAYCDFGGDGCCAPEVNEEYCIPFNASLRDYCPHSNLIDDGICDFDENFNPSCSFDGDDCIAEGVGQAPKCPLLFLINNNRCDDVTNNALCLFDGGDCCQRFDPNWTCNDCQCLNGHSTKTNDEGCAYPGALNIGDGVCDDINNHPFCKYDGGDCCNPNADHNYCYHCACFDPMTGPIQECYRPLWVGDGFCDDYTNHARCNYDGGDCCLEKPDKTYCHKCQCITEDAKEPSENVTVLTAEPTKLKRTNIANSNLGLKILLYPNAEKYHYSSDNNFVGFKVLVHSPYNFPEVAGKGLVVGAGSEASIAVGAKYTSTSEDVLMLPLKKRKCLKHDEDLKMYPEVKLEAFQNYSRKACLLECQAHDLMRVCGCLPYFFPDFGSIWGKNTACDLKGLQCLANTADQMKALQPEGQSDTEGYIQNAPICYCPNDCDEVSYTQEMSFFTIKNGSEFFKNLYNEPNILFKKHQLLETVFFLNSTKAIILDEIQRIIHNSSIVHIYFKEIGIIKFSRDQVYTIMDVIAAFGGIISLCCGFSMLSLVEILYWFSVRIYTDHYRKSHMHEPIAPQARKSDNAKPMKGLIRVLKQKEKDFCQGHPKLKWIVYILSCILFLLILVICIYVPIHELSDASNSKTTVKVTTTTTIPTTIVGFEEAYTAGKIFVATGFAKIGYSSRHGEVIDVLGGSTCTQYGDFPFDVFGATAAILPGMWSPLICGGETKSGEQLNKCYILGQDTPYVTMTEIRVRAASITLNHTHILVSGGYRGPIYSDTSEIISMLDGTTENGPKLPHRVRSHCFIRVSGNRAMLIGGYQDDIPLPSVYYLNLDTFEWAQGPDLNTARTSAACGTYTSNEETYVVVTGGYTSYAISSTEVMSVTYGTYWMQGPELPFGISDIAMVTNPQGNGVIALAGWSDPWPSFRDELFVLSCNGSSCSNWTQLESKLSMPRFGCIALSVPDDIC